MLERLVGDDLEHLCRTGVLGVLEQLLLAAGTAHEIQWRLAERHGLRNHGLGRSEDHRERISALAERLQACTDARGVVARLVQMGLERGTVGPVRGHGDLRLQVARQRLLRGMRLA